KCPAVGVKNSLAVLTARLGPLEHGPGFGRFLYRGGWCCSGTVVEDPAWWWSFRIREVSLPGRVVLQRRGSGGCCMVVVFPVRCSLHLSVPIDYMCGCFGGFHGLWFCCTCRVE